jgi:molybdopterin converting factor small subunit
MGPNDMVNIHIKLPSHLARMLKADSVDWLIIEKEIAEGTTVKDLLSILVMTYPGFRKSVFNPDAGSVNEQINVVLNNELLTFEDMSHKLLADNDTVTILPMYFGG